MFLTTKSGTGDSKIYQTHNQWTSDGKWVIFRSDRVKGDFFEHVRASKSYKYGIAHQCREVKVYLTQT